MQAPWTRITKSYAYQITEKTYPYQRHVPRGGGGGGVLWIYIGGGGVPWHTKYGVFGAGTTQNGGPYVRLQPKKGGI